MGNIQRLLILALFIATSFSAPAPLAKPHFPSTASTSIPTFIITRLSLASTSSSLLALPDEATKTLIAKDVNIEHLDRRGWTKLQYGIFLGWMIPFGVFVLSAFLYIFFGARVHEAWRKCWGMKGDS
jgi:hypothetical protein